MSNALPPKPRIIGPKVRICIVASKYNEQFTDALVENAIEELGELVPQGRVDLIRVPGAFEIPVMVASVLDRDPPACVIALGGVRSGLFSNDEVLAAQLSAAGQRTLDYCWRMPLDDEYAEALKSRFADVANVGDRAAGSVTAAKFLQRFVGETPWAHLDIAGTAWKSGAAKGATGRPVRLLLQYLLDLEVNQRKTKAK